MAKTTLVWTTNAKNDLSEIGAFIAKDSVDRAVEFTQRLFDSTVQLETFPLSGPLCPEDASCRQLSLEGYRIIYEISENGIFILTIISPGLNAIRAIASAKKP